MTTFIYNIIERSPYLTEVTYGGGDLLEIRINECQGGVLRMGSTAVNLEDGVGRVKLSALCDGTIVPEAVLKEKSVFLYPIVLSCGKISLAHPERICADLGKYTLQMSLRISDLEKELHKLNDAVYGKAIF